MNREDIKPMRREFQRVGPWIVSSFVGKIGEHHVIEVPIAMPRAAAVHRGFLVSGRWRMVQTPEGIAPFPDMLAGEYTGNRPAWPAAGIYIVECMEDDTHFVCVQRGAFIVLPGFRCRFAAGITAQFTIPQNGVFVMGSGTLRTRRGNISGFHALWAGAQDENVLPQNGGVTGMLAVLPI